MLRAVGLRNGRHPGSVCNGRVHRPLGGVHVREGRVEAGALAGSVAVVGVGALVVCVVVLRAGDGGVGGAVVLQVEGAVADLLGRVLLLLAVMAGAQLLRLDVCPLLGLPWLAAQRGQGVLGLLRGLLRRLGWLRLRRRLWLLRLLGHPDMPCAGWSGCRAADSVAACIGDLAGLAMGGRDPGVAVGREILVKLIDVKGLNVGDDVAAELTNVHVSEVDVGRLPSSFLQGAPFPFQVLLTGLHICFRGSGRGRWPLRLSCRKHKRNGICQSQRATFPSTPLKSKLQASHTWAYLPTDKGSRQSAIKRWKSNSSHFFIYKQEVLYYDDNSING